MASRVAGVFASARSMSIAEVERQIQLNLDVLSTTLVDVSQRHRSLRAVFDHSWNLLDDSERSLLAHLSLFRGGCSLEAARQITGATLSTLEALVGKSLLRQESARFVLLETIREYAVEKLTALGDIEMLRRAHAAYYVTFAENTAEQWDGPLADAAVEQLDREHDNLLAALQWASTGGELTLALRLAGALWRFWRTYGYINEGQVWLADLLAHDYDASDTDTLYVRLHVLEGTAWLASDQHDYVQAARLFEESMALRRMLGDIEGENNLLINAARQARAAGQYQRATALLEDSLARYRSLGDRGSIGNAGIGLTFYELGLVLREQGEFDRASALFKESLELHYEIGDQEGIIIALLALGDVARDQGDAARLQEYCEQSLALARELGMQWAMGFSLNNLALAAYFEGDLPRALNAVNESVALFRSLKSDSSLAEVLITQGQVLTAQGDLSSAYTTLTEALWLAWAVGPRFLVVAALETLARQGSSADRVVRLLAVAAALRLQIGTRARPAEQVVLEQMLADARSVLGATACTALWDAARKLRLDEAAITMLLSDVNLPPGGPRVDWDDAFSVPVFYGREWELEVLTEWVIEERCRVVSILGMGGIGKSTLAVNLMHRLASRFDVVIWRSVRDSPDCEALIDDYLQVLVPEIAVPPAGLERRLSLLLEQLRGQRVLLVLDNLESLLEEGEGAGRMRPGYEGYGRMMRRLAETDHRSCMLLTSREKPGDIVSLEGSRSPVRTLRVSRLDATACDQLLADSDIEGTDSDRARLVEAYAGNPLALRIVSQSIVELFDGEIAPFLEQGEIIFGGVRGLLSEQFSRLSALEQSVLLWLAILREPSTLEELSKVMVIPVPRVRLFEAIEALRRRSLIEHGQFRGSFTLQAVVLEYMITRLIADVSQEIEQGHPVRLIEYGLSLAQAHEFVRETQQRLIIAPVLAHLSSRYGQPDAVDQQLRVLLRQMSAMPEQGYGPANLVALLHLHRGDLRRLDLSQVVLRSASLQGVEMQDTLLSGATIRDSVFNESFDVMTAVAISPTAEYWAAAGGRGEVQVWTAGGTILHRVWRAHDSMIWALNFSPDGRALASGSWDATVKIWDVASGALLWSGKHISHVNIVGFSPDGTVLASSSDDATTRFWDRQRGTPLQTLSHPGPASGVGVLWSPDGRLFVSGDMEGHIRLWEIQKTGPAICIQTLEAHTSIVDGLAFSPDGRTLTSVSWDATVKLWNVASDQLELAHILTGHTDLVYRVVWSPDGRTLATCSRDQTIWLWDVQQASFRAALRGHTAGVRALAFTPDSRILLSGSEDGTLRVWDSTDGLCIRVMQGYTSSFVEVDWSPDDTQLVSGSRDYTVTLFSVAGGTAPRVLRGHKGGLNSVGWSPDGCWLASSEWDNAVRLWDAASGVCLQVLRHPDDSGNYFFGLDWSPDGQKLAVGTYRRGVQVYEIGADHQHWVGHPFPTWIRRVLWSPDGTQLAGAGDNGSVYLWDAEQGTLLHQLGGHQSMVASIAWSPDGQWLASGSGSGKGSELFIRDVRLEQPVITLASHPAIVYALAWSADSELLISGSSDGRLRWWDIHSGKCLWVREAHPGTVHGLRRSHDGTKLASCGNDGSIVLWDLRTGEYLRTLRRDRPYERVNISGIRGLTEAQKATLYTLGAVEDAGF